MPYSPITLPDSTLIDRSDYEVEPNTPQTDGTLAEIYNAVASTPLALGAFEVHKYFNRYINHGDFLTPKDASKKYPNVNFPKGGYENVIRLTSERKAIQDGHQDLINNMPKGWLTTGEKTTGWIIGSAMSPLTSIGGNVLNSIASKLGSKFLLTKLGENVVTRALTKAGIGIGEGAALMTPLALSYKGMKDELQEPVTWKETAENIGLGALTGGVLRTAFGFHPVVSQDSVKQAFTIADEQMRAGKQVNVEPTLKNGMFEQSKQSKLLPSDVKRVQTDLDDRVIKINQDIEKATKDGDQSKVDNLSIKKQILDNSKKETDAYSDLLINKPNSLSPDELQSSVNNLNSWHSNVTTYLDEHKINNETLAQPETNLDKEIQSLSEDVNEMRDNNLLDKDQQNLVRRAEEEVGNSKKISQALKDYFKCQTDPKRGNSEL